MFSLTLNNNARSIETLDRVLSRFAAAWNQQRPQRVTWLLFAVLALSMFDLVVTVQQMSTTGMLEDNPIARMVVEMTGTSASLIGLKALSLAFSLGLLHRLRKNWQAEVGTWIALGVLCWLTAQWCMYLKLMHGLDHDAFMTMADDLNWIAK